MDTSVGTVWNSHEECNSPTDESGESGQWSKLFTEGKYSWYFSVIKINVILALFFNYQYYDFIT